MYLRFCDRLNFNPTPASEDQLILFVTELAQSRAISTIRCYLAAVRHLHVIRGLPSPTEKKLKLDLVLRGIQRRRPTRRDTRLPITPLILRIARRELERSPEQDSKMMWAAMCIGFFGFMRTGEFTVTNTSETERILGIADVSVDSRENPRLVSLHLRYSKTDQFGEGVRISLARNDTELCPVAAVLAYIAVRPPIPGPLLVTTKRTALTRRVFVQRLQEILAAAGMNPAPYKGHSFRIGAATTAAAAGIPDSTIQMLGRWSSNAFQAYIRTPPTELAAIAARLSGGVSGPEGRQAEDRSAS